MLINSKHTTTIRDITSNRINNMTQSAESTHVCRKGYNLKEH